MGRGREPGLYRAIAEIGDLRAFFRSTAVPGIDLMAASRELAAVDDLRGRIGIQTALKRPLAKLSCRWDLVLIDCPPNSAALSERAGRRRRGARACGNAWHRRDRAPRLDANHRGCSRVAGEPDARHRCDRGDQVQPNEG